MTTRITAAVAAAAPPAADAVRSIGVGIDTARYGHRVSFLRDDRQPAAKPLDVSETQAGYQLLRRELERLHGLHPQAQLRVHLDAAGQYAANLEGFLRKLPLPLVISIGEPKRNKDYHQAMSPKRTSDDTESRAMARFGVVEQPAPTLPTPPDVALLREIAGRLRTQSKDTTRAFNRLHNLLSRVFPELVLLLSKLRGLWVLDLLDKYPTPQRIAAARLESLKKLPHIKAARAEKIQQAARESIASLTGELAEALVRDQVAQVRQCLIREKTLEKLLSKAFQALPKSGHSQLLSIPGIGPGTAAVLVAKIVDIARFATPENLVGYFGVFPVENGSGVDRTGQPLKQATMQMSAKGCDLVRHYLWNAAKSAARHNPPVRALYQRLVARGANRSAALGHCMRKLLHQVHGVWTSEPFDAQHRSADQAANPVETATVDSAAVDSAAGESAANSTVNIAEASVAEVVATEPCTCVAEKETAAGHKRDIIPESRVVTAAASLLEPVREPLPASLPRGRGSIDYDYLRKQIDLERVLTHLGVRHKLHASGQGQWRGGCPLCHTGGTFSVNLQRSVYRCFHAGCSKGNVLDFWMRYRDLPLSAAAKDLADTFGLQTQRARPT